MKTLKPNANPVQPRIHVICVEAKLYGYFYGKWIDAHQSPEELTSDIQDFLKKSPIPDSKTWSIHSCEDFCGLALGEYMDAHMISELADFIIERGALGAALYLY